ncbi:MAG TPA: DinB family protein [Vicinamibacterales bacterium]|nr:DinB family protein [Vicinamibacterales bacterium]
MLETPPDRSEAADYYFKYIELVPGGNIRDILAAQRDSTTAFFAGITAVQSRTTYQPGKWSIADTLRHVIDAERLFVFRAWWFARGFESPLPSFDQEAAANAARALDRPWTRDVEHFDIVRNATMAFFESLSADAWLRCGSASGNTFSVRALAHIVAGHVIHHTRIVKERYLTT